MKAYNLEERQFYLKAQKHPQQVAMMKMSLNAVNNFLAFEKEQKENEGKKLFIPTEFLVQNNLYNKFQLLETEQAQPQGPTDLVNVFLNLFAADAPETMVNGWKINFQTSEDTESARKQKARKQQFYNDFYRQSVESQQKEIEQLRALKRQEAQFVVQEAAAGLYDKI